MSEFPNPCPYGGILYEGNEFGEQPCPLCGRDLIVNETRNPRWPDHSRAHPLDELVWISEEYGLYDDDPRPIDFMSKYIDQHEEER